jgi:hypothetical protein
MLSLFSAAAVVNGHTSAPHLFVFVMMHQPGYNGTKLKPIEKFG